MQGIRKIIGYPILAYKRRLLKRFKQGLVNTKEIQREKLFEKLKLCESSAFAKDYKLKYVKTADEFRKRVPIAGYERMQPYIHRVIKGETCALFCPGTKLLMMAMTSGTTGPSKHIPVTAVSAKEYERSWAIWGCSLAEQHPEIPFSGVASFVSDYSVSQTKMGLPCGNISGLLAELMSPTMKLINVLPVEVSKIEDTKLKYYLALKLALVRSDIRMLTTANPSSLLMVAKYLSEWSEDLIRDIRDGTLKNSEQYPKSVLEALPSINKAYPERGGILGAIASHGPLSPRNAWGDLELLGVWTGGTLKPWIQRLNEYYGEISLRDHGLSASEGRITIPLEDDTSAGILDIYSSYYEFIPESEYEKENPQVLEAHELDVGENYFVVLTTSGGLFRYDMSDLVKCVNYYGQAPILTFLNKGSQISSITGEKLSAHQVSNVLSDVQKETAISLGPSALAPIWADTPAYHLLVENRPILTEAKMDRLCRLIDEGLKSQNIEYRDKRASGRIGELSYTFLKAGTWEDLMKRKLAESGASLEQYKHPCLITDMELAKELADSGNRRK